MSGTVDNFQNTAWVITDLQSTEGLKSFPTVNADITLYQNDNFEAYVDWLAVGAETFVGDTVPLTQNNLSSFRTNI